MYAVIVDCLLAYPPHNNIYFSVSKLVVVQNYLPGCQNKQVLLDQLARVGTADYCLAHLLTGREMGCVLGLGNLGGVCRPHSNMGWSKLDPVNDDITGRSLVNAGPEINMLCEFLTIQVLKKMTSAIWLN